jgi:hypothetical protein
MAQQQRIAGTVTMKRIKKILCWPLRWPKKLINKIKLEIRYRKKLKELRKRDPFIYK